MDTLDEISTATLKAANITEAQLAELTRDDIRDLLPGPKHFFRRKAIWSVAHQEEESSNLGTSRAKVTEPSTSCSSGPSVSISSTPSPSKIMKTPSLEYVLYTDSELEQARKHYFEQQLAGKEQECVLSKELRCRLIRKTVTNMISVLRATVDDFAYPSKHDIIAMARRLVEYFPMLRDRSVFCKFEWETVTRLLMKRLENVRTPRKSRSSEKNKSSSGMNKNTAKRQHLEFGSGSMDNLSSMSADECDADSSGSIVLNKSPFRSSTPETSEQDEGSDQNGQDSQQTQARHYRTFQEIYKTKKPNKSAVSQLLDLEFQSRRAFIDADVMKEQDRPTKIFEAYPCFKEIDHLEHQLRHTDLVIY
ncbi:uncharacterized protein LOC143508959 [Brachyhypopomus gauderio]|uniref:uncharacterized protein LOC143508959 n=1 Tax=Brachyhypopomus gauderio TaxID=698409 RepID=UPI004041D8AA